MTHHAPSFSLVLAALGLFSAAAAGAAEADTSQWKCEKCPYTKGASGSVEAGVGLTSEDSTTFGNFTGLKDKGAHLLLAGKLAYRGEGGYLADLAAGDLGIDTRHISAQIGREGLYSLQLGYSEIPRYFAEGARTPFLGAGTDRLTLPAAAGFPAATTAGMPLDSTLQPAELGYRAKRFDLGGKWIGEQDWTYRVSLRRDVRDGTRPTAGSFFSTTSQLAAPVDETTDQLEVGVSYVTPRFQAALAYQLSQFKNGNEALTWDNPFQAVQGGDTRGQLALAPNNQFRQVTGSLGFQISPAVRASADIAWGQGTQDAGFLAPTLNSTLPQPVPALPAQSLDGEVETFNFNARISAAPMPGLRLNAAYARNVRDNQTAIQAYPQVATDIFLRPDLRSNTPFDLTQDRVKLNADYRVSDRWKLSGGVDWDSHHRSYQEVVTTRETTVWGRATVQATDQLSLVLKTAYGDRNGSTYGTAYWFGATSNPLMRKYNLADRERSSVGARADWAVSETVSVGLNADWTNDDYNETVIGLNKSRTTSLGADISVALSEQTKLGAYAQGESVHARQTGSQLFSVADWTGKVDDRFRVLGFSVGHTAMAGKLDLAADVSFARSHSDVSVETAVGEPPFPRNSTSLDTLKIRATYKLQESMWLTGSFWHERYDSQAWPLDGVLPATVSNLLAFGAQAPQYRVNVLRVALRYRF